MELTRRNFVAGTTLAGAAALGAVACKPASAHTVLTTIPETWDDETDVVVVGYGASGVAAGITAAQEGIEAIVLEKSTEPDGGNLGCATGCIQTCMHPDSEEEFLEKLLHFDHGANPEAEAETLCTSIIEQEIEAADWLDDLDDLEIYWVWRDYGEPAKMTGEVAWSERGDSSGSELWGNFHEIAADMGVDVRLGTPATRLIQNPETREILGVVAEKDGAEIAIKARKGVILACGGFAGNPQMQQYYTGWGIRYWPWGTPNNTGDGIMMAQSAGAQLWHMCCSEIGSPCYRQASESVNCSVTMLASGHYKNASSWIFVNRYGQRFTNETKGISHAPLYSRQRSVWFDMDSDTAEFINQPYWMVFDQATYESGPLYIQSTKDNMAVSYAGVHQLLGQEWTNDWAQEQGWIVKADTLEELAAKMTGTTPAGEQIEGIDAEALVATVEAYNATAEAGEGDAFKRNPDNCAALGDGPYYAIEMGMGIINTQGGPKHNEHNQTLDVNDQVIPRLYNVGELGSLNGGNYTLGNIAEALTTGHFAMLHAGELENWDA
jgi:succinate dehydrogenase/fumarate reductase flavoprotein subunit